MIKIDSRHIVYHILDKEPWGEEINVITVLFEGFWLSFITILLSTKDRLSTNVQIIGKPWKFIQQADDFHIAKYVFNAYDPNICLYRGYHFVKTHFTEEDLPELDISEFCPDDVYCFRALKFTNKTLSNEDLNTCKEEAETSIISNKTICTEEFSVDCK